MWPLYTYRRSQASLGSREPGGVTWESEWLKGLPFLGAPWAMLLEDAVLRASQKQHTKQGFYVLPKAPPFILLVDFVSIQSYLVHTSGQCHTMLPCPKIISEPLYTSYLPTVVREKRFQSTFTAK